jgi:hypothetical protein
MQCPACNLSQATSKRSETTLDTLDIDCLSCAAYSVTGPERLDLAHFTPDQREQLSQELRKASRAGEPLLLSHGFSRRVLERGWAIAPRARYARSAKLDGRNGKPAGDPAP